MYMEYVFKTVFINLEIEFFICRSFPENSGFNQSQYCSSLRNIYCGRGIVLSHTYFRAAFAFYLKYTSVGFLLMCCTKSSPNPKINWLKQNASLFLSYFHIAWRWPRLVSRIWGLLSGFSPCCGLYSPGQLMVQSSCQSPSPYIHVPTSKKKGERGKKDIPSLRIEFYILFPFIYH